jgi:hypothetical protein
MDTKELHVWLQGFLAAGGNPDSPEGRATIEHMLADEEPDPLCPDCARRARQQWLEQYLRYYEQEPAEG